MEQAYRIITPKSLARFLSANEEAKYKEIINKKYSSEKVRKIFDVPSNLFKVIELQNQGVNIVGLSDSGLIIEQNMDWISMVGVDIPGIVLRNIRGYSLSSDFLANDLANQIKKRGLKNPVIVTGLNLEESTDSVYGLKFKTTDKTEVYEAPELSRRNNKKKFSKTNERGIPIFDKNGNRTLYTKDCSISRLRVYGNSHLDSTWINLAYSPPDCQVVVVDTEDVAHKNL